MICLQLEDALTESLIKVPLSHSQWHVLKLRWKITMTCAKYKLLCKKHAMEILCIGPQVCEQTWRCIIKWRIYFLKKKKRKKVTWTLAHWPLARTQNVRTARVGDHDRVMGGPRGPLPLRARPHSCLAITVFRVGRYATHAATPHRCAA
jgi:hypothetical protein